MISSGPIGRPQSKEESSQETTVKERYCPDEETTPGRGMDPISSYTILKTPEQIANPMTISDSLMEQGNEEVETRDAASSQRHRSVTRRSTPREETEGLTDLSSENIIAIFRKIEAESQFLDTDEEQ